jgi:cell division ATPase FtsA
VRLGRPLRVQGLPQSACGPAFSACVGLALFAAHPQDEWWDFDDAGRPLPGAQREARRALVPRQLVTGPSCVHRPQNSGPVGGFPPHISGITPIFA